MLQRVTQSTLRVSWGIPERGEVFLADAAAGSELSGKACSSGLRNLLGSAAACPAAGVGRAGLVSTGRSRLVSTLLARGELGWCELARWRNLQRGTVLPWGRRTTLRWDRGRRTALNRLAAAL